MGVPSNTLPVFGDSDEERALRLSQPLSGRITFGHIGLQGGDPPGCALDSRNAVALRGDPARHSRSPQIEDSGSLP